MVTSSRWARAGDGARAAGVVGGVLLWLGWSAVACTVGDDAAGREATPASQSPAPGQSMPGAGTTPPTAPRPPAYRIERTGGLRLAGGESHPYAISGGALAVTRPASRGIELYDLADGAGAVGATGLAGLSQSVDLCGPVAIGPAAGRTSGMIGIDPATGTTRWAAPEGGAGSRAPSSGVWRVFCAGGRLAMAVEVAGSGTWLRAVDAATGAGRWNVELGGLDDVRSSDDAVYLDGAGRDGRSVQALDLGDGSVRWERTGDRNLVLGGAYGVLVEQGSGAGRSLEVLDGASGDTILSVPGRYEPFEGVDVLAGSVRHPALVLERGTVVSDAGVAEIRSLPGLGQAGGTSGPSGTVGTSRNAATGRSPGTTAPGGVRVLGVGPDGLVWVTSPGAILLVDVVAMRIAASVPVPDAVGLAATRDVVVLTDGTILRVRRG